jgi:hypothetical protein
MRREEQRLQTTAPKPIPDPEPPAMRGRVFFAVFTLLDPAAIR